MTRRTSNSCQTVVAGYLERGWVPVPIPKGKKGPIIDDWQNLEFETTHWKTPKNIGINLGPSGLIDIDLDCAEARKLAKKFLPPTATFGRASSPRSHWIYSSSAARYRKFLDPVDGKCLLEIRAGDGKQTVFPGSVHTSGEAIEWSPGREFSDEDPSEAAAQLAVAAWELKHPDREMHPKVAAWIAHGDASDDAPGVAAAVPEFYTGIDDDLIEEIVQSCPEGSRHDYRLAVAGAMYRAGIGETSARKMLAEAMGDERLGDDRSNAVRDAKLSVRDTFHSAGPKTGTASLINTFGAQAVVDRIGVLVTPDDLELEPKRKKNPLDLITCREIFEPLPPVDWTIEGLDICPGAVHMLAGYGYSGKTMAAQALALGIAAGRPVWGQFPAAKGKVLHLDYEQGRRLTALRYQRLAFGLGVHERQLKERLTIGCMPKITLVSPKAEEVLMRTCEGHTLLLIDSLRAATPGIEENSSEIRAYLDLLSRVSDETGCSVLVIHHARKSEGEHGKMAIRGSGAIFDACASVLVFQADRGDQVTSVRHEKARTSGETTADFALRIEDVADGADMKKGLRVSVVAAVSKLESNQDRVLRALQNSPDRMFASRAALVSAAGMRKADALAAVDELKDRGLISVDDMGPRGSQKIALRGR